jgi:segregation and condensation protein B
MELKNIVETILFAAEKPLTLPELREIFSQAGEGEFSTEQSRGHQKVREKDLEQAIQDLNKRYDESRSGLQIREIADAFQLVSRSDYVPWLRRLFEAHRPQRLSQPAMETLAIIAYRQPITRADIEAIRGVAVDGVVQTLLERGLIKITGRSEVPGRPLLYATTHEFLEHFGLKNVDDLPAVEELRKVNICLPEAAPAGSKEADDKDDDSDDEDDQDDEDEEEEKEKEEEKDEETEDEEEDESAKT